MLLTAIKLLIEDYKKAKLKEMKEAAVAAAAAKKASGEETDSTEVEDLSSSIADFEIEVSCLAFLSGILVCHCVTDI